MSILGIALTIIIVGVLLWLAVTYIPMQPPFKNILIAFVVIATVIFILVQTGALAQTGLTRPIHF